MDGLTLTILVAIMGFAVVGLAVSVGCDKATNPTGWITVWNSIVVAFIISHVLLIWRLLETIDYFRRPLQTNKVITVTPTGLAAIVGMTMLVALGSVVTAVCKNHKAMRRLARIVGFLGMLSSLLILSILILCIDKMVV